VELQSRHIAAGMSGSAVLDIERNLVVGLVAERYYPRNAIQDDLSFGVDLKVLTFDPFNFNLCKKKLELRAAPIPKRTSQAKKPIWSNPKIYLEQCPIGAARMDRPR